MAAPETYEPIVHYEQTFTYIRENVFIAGRQRLAALIDGFNQFRSIPGTEAEGSQDFILLNLADIRISVGELRSLKSVLPPSDYDKYIEDGKGGGILYQSLEASKRKDRLPPIRTGRFFSSNYLKQRYGLPFALAENDLVSPVDEKWAVDLGSYLESERVRRENEQVEVSVESPLEEIEDRPQKRRFAGFSRLFKDKAQAVKTFIKEHKPDPSSAVEPIGEVAKKVTSFKFLNRSVGDHLKDTAIRGTLTAAIGAGLGTVGTVGIPLGALTGGTVSLIMESRRQYTESQFDKRKLALAFGTGAVFGAGGGLVGVLNLSDTAVGQAAKGMVGAVGGVLGGLKDEVFKAVAATTENPPIEIKLEPNPLLPNPHIAPGPYSPAIEIPNLSESWIKDANNINGEFAKAMQSIVGKNVGEVGVDLSYLEYGLQRGLEAHGLTMEDVDPEVLKTNRRELLGLMESRVNEFSAGWLKSAVDRNIDLDEMKFLVNNTYDLWLDRSALDDLAKEVKV